jgi:hypothetical protein
MSRRRAIAAAAVVAMVAGGCGTDTAEGPGADTASPAATGDAIAEGSAPAGTAGEPAGTADPEAADATADGIVEVPGELASIQAAVDAASPGDLVLISPGTYREAVDVTTDELTIRGLDRGGVILDGGFELENGIRVVGANGVAVENMTAINYTKNGFFWTGVEGYRGSYLTAIRNGDYGIYAFDSTKGQLDHSYAAGSPDAGFYIGQCFPCDAVIDAVLAEHNGLGYSGTNSGGNLLIVNSTFRFNRAGVVPNSGSYELCYPERETTIVGNVVYSNNQPDTPAIDVAILAMGNGILLAGGIRNVIERNLVYDHDKTGIGLVPFLEEDANDDLPTPEEWDVDCATQKNEPVAAEIPDSLLWDSQQNRVVGNVLDDNRTADLGVASAGGDVSAFGNCWGGNTFTTSAPAAIEALAPCDAAAGSGDWSAGALDVVSWLVEAETRPPSVDYRTAVLPDPPKLENMPDAATAPARPATDVPAPVDLAAIAVPGRPG